MTCPQFHIRQSERIAYHRVWEYGRYSRLAVCVGVWMVRRPTLDKSTGRGTVSTHLAASCTAASCSTGHSSGARMLWPLYTRGWWPGLILVGFAGLGGQTRWCCRRMCQTRGWGRGRFGRGMPRLSRSGGRTLARTGSTTRHAIGIVQSQSLQWQDPPWQHRSTTSTSLCSSHRLSR
jgi:hypothetical protein